MTKRKARKAPEQSTAPIAPEDNQESAVDTLGERHPGGRPTEYRPEFCQTAAELSESGATDQEIADALEISARTLYRWYAAHPEFRQAVKLGKDSADDRVERSLYHRAVGYTYPAVKIMQNNGTPVYAEYVEHVPPDPGAAFNWLKNRRPDTWRDRRELTGADGGALQVKSVIEFVSDPGKPGAVPE